MVVRDNLTNSLNFPATLLRVTGIFLSPPRINQERASSLHFHSVCRAFLIDFAPAFALILFYLYDSVFNLNFCYLP